MAKERADKPRKEKAEKAEKKVSKDKVKKHKKDKKPKLEVSSEASGDESEHEYIALNGKSKAPVESSNDSSKPQYKDKKEKRRKERKQKKAEKELKKKSKKGAIEDAVAAATEVTVEAAAEAASNGDAPDTVELPVRPVSKGSDGSANSDSDSDSDASEDEGEGAPLFTIDVNPSQVVPRVLEEKPEKEGEKQPGPQRTNPPSGLNRQERRRIRMIEEQREKIQKKLDVPVGSQEKADEVQAQLDKWVSDFDEKAAMRLEKKRARKSREANRIRNKRGKLLTGRRLKERQKELQKMEKKAGKQGLSAPTATAA